MVSLIDSAKAYAKNPNKLNMTTMGAPMIGSSGSYGGTIGGSPQQGQAQQQPVRTPGQEIAYNSYGQSTAQQGGGYGGRVNPQEGMGYSLPGGGNSGINPLYNSANKWGPQPGTSAPYDPNRNFKYYSQPGDMPNVPYTGPIIAASQRTGITPEMMPSTSSIASQLSGSLPSALQGKDIPTVQGQFGLLPQFSAQQAINYADPATNQAISRKMGMGLSDFGIPQSVMEAMKVQQAQKINSTYDVQKEAARRMMAKAGLLNDPAAIKTDAELDQAKLGEIFNQYTNIDTQNAMEQNKQYQQNLNDLISAGQGRSKLGSDITSQNVNNILNQFKANEEARQFERTLGLDVSREQSKQQELMQNIRNQRLAALMSDAKWLEGLDFETRAKLSSGLLDKGVQMTDIERQSIADAMGNNRVYT